MSSAFFLLSWLIVADCFCVNHALGFDRQCFAAEVSMVLILPVTKGFTAIRWQGQDGSQSVLGGK